MATTISSKETIKANRPAFMMPGLISGSVILNMVLIGPAPRAREAFSSDLSNPLRVAEMMMMTYGDAKMVWAIINPNSVPTNLSFAK